MNSWNRQPHLTCPWPPLLLFTAVQKLTQHCTNLQSCLADHLADIDNDVFIHCRTIEVIDSLNHHHRNPKYLKGVPLQPGVLKRYV